MPKKKSATQLIKSISTNSNSNCVKQVFSITKETDNAHHVCLGKQSTIQLLNTIQQAQNSNSLKQQNFHHK